MNPTIYNLLHSALKPLSSYRSKKEQVKVSLYRAKTGGRNEQDFDDSKKFKVQVQYGN